MYLLVIHLEIRACGRRDLSTLSYCFQNVESLGQVWKSKKLELSSVLPACYSTKKRYMQRRQISISKCCSLMGNMFNLYTECHRWWWWEIRVYAVAEMEEIKSMRVNDWEGGHLRLWDLPLRSRCSLSNSLSTSC